MTGKGLIMLLHGAPGVGKTSTATGIAQLFKRPLLEITCGDLGTTPREVESNLSNHFTLASKWGCILIIDEADVFLATRTPQDFIRNGMVSVRLGDLDEAFGSRIHISLHYPQLDLPSTLEVFELTLKLVNEHFTRQGRELSVDSTAILEFAERYWNEHPDMRWNGRQIRNACQTALALAEFKAQGGNHLQVLDPGAKISLGVDQLDVVKSVYLEFVTYLKDIFDKDANRRAKQMGIRAREAEKEHADTWKGKPPIATRAANQQPTNLSGLGGATNQPGGQAPMHAMTPAQASSPAVFQPTPQYPQYPIAPVAGHPTQQASGFAGGMPTHIGHGQQPPIQEAPGYTGETPGHPAHGQQPHIGNLHTQYPHPTSYSQVPQAMQYQPPETTAAGTGYALPHPPQAWNAHPQAGWQSHAIPPPGQTQYPYGSAIPVYGGTPSTGPQGVPAPTTTEVRDMSEPLN